MPIYKQDDTRNQDIGGTYADNNKILDMDDCPVIEDFNDQDFEPGCLCKPDLWCCNTQLTYDPLTGDLTIFQIDQDGNTTSHVTNIPPIELPVEECTDVEGKAPVVLNNPPIELVNLLRTPLVNGDKIIADYDFSTITWTWDGSGWNAKVADKRCDQPHCVVINTLMPTDPRPGDPSGILDATGAPIDVPEVGPGCKFRVQYKNGYVDYKLNPDCTSHEICCIYEDIDPIASVSAVCAESDDCVLSQHADKFGGDPDTDFEVSYYTTPSNSNVFSNETPENAIPAYDDGLTETKFNEIPEDDSLFKHEIWRYTGPGPIPSTIDLTNPTDVILVSSSCMRLECVQLFIKSDPENIPLECVDGVVTASQFPFSYVDKDGETVINDQAQLEAFLESWKSGMKKIDGSPVKFVVGVHVELPNCPPEIVFEVSKPPTATISCTNGGPGKFNLAVGGASDPECGNPGIIFGTLTFTDENGAALDPPLADASVTENPDNGTYCLDASSYPEGTMIVACYTVTDGCGTSEEVCTDPKEVVLCAPAFDFTDFSFVDGLGSVADIVLQIEENSASTCLPENPVYNVAFYEDEECTELLEEMDMNPFGGQPAGTAKLFIPQSFYIDAGVTGGDIFWVVITVSVDDCECDAIIKKSAAVSCPAVSRSTGANISTGVSEQDGEVCFTIEDGKFNRGGLSQVIALEIKDIDGNTIHDYAQGEGPDCLYVPPGDYIACTGGSVNCKVTVPPYSVCEGVANTSFTGPVSISEFEQSYGISGETQEFTLVIDFTTIDISDRLEVIYEGNVLLDTGYVTTGTGAQQFTVNIIPNVDDFFTIRINNPPNPNSSATDTIWNYQIRCEPAFCPEDCTIPFTAPLVTLSSSSILDNGTSRPNRQICLDSCPSGVQPIGNEDWFKEGCQAPQSICIDGPGVTPGLCKPDIVVGGNASRDDCYQVSAASNISNNGTQITFTGGTHGNVFSAMDNFNPSHGDIYGAVLELYENTCPGDTGGTLLNTITLYWKSGWTSSGSITPEAFSWEYISCDPECDDDSRVGNSESQSASSILGAYETLLNHGGGVKFISGSLHTDGDVCLRWQETIFAGGDIPTVSGINEHTFQYGIDSSCDNNENPVQDYTIRYIFNPATPNSWPNNAEVYLGSDSATGTLLGDVNSLSAC